MAILALFIGLWIGGLVGYAIAFESIMRDYKMTKKRRSHE